MKKEEWQQKVASAFADVPYPGDDNIGHPEGRDDADLLTKILRGRSWASLQPDELRWLKANFMSPQAFHYYLAAYLTADFVDGTDDFFHELTPPHLYHRRLKELLEEDDNDHMEWAKDEFDLRFRDFTVAQKQIVFEFFDSAYQQTLGKWKMKEQKIASEHQRGQLESSPAHARVKWFQEEIAEEIPRWLAIIAYWKNLANRHPQNL